jgi:hypothetical protein
MAYYMPLLALSREQEERKYARKTMDRGSVLKQNTIGVSGQESPPLGTEEIPRISSEE